MKENLRIAILFTLVTTIVFGVLYPLGVTGLAQLLFPAQSNGRPDREGRTRSRFEAAGPDVLFSRIFSSAPIGGRDRIRRLAIRLAKLGAHQPCADRSCEGDVDKLHTENPGAAIPVDLVTTSGSGLDPEISPAAAEFQVSRVARERGMTQADVRAMVAKHTLARQFVFLASHACGCWS